MAEQWQADMHPALGGMQAWDSGRTQTLRFKAVTMRTVSQRLSEPSLRSVNATLPCGKGLPLLRVRCSSPHADPRFSRIINPLFCRALLERAWDTRGSWCFLWKPPLLSFFTRSVVNALGTWIASLPPAVFWEHPGRWVSHASPLAWCCFV